MMCEWLWRADAAAADAKWRQTRHGDAATH